MNILITGSSGYIGMHLSRIAEERGHKILHLSRKKCIMKNYFTWNIDNNQIDEKAIELADAIIHLAGENIGSGRWSKKRKRQIIESRTQGTKLLMNAISKAEHKPKIFISASATGFYGAYNSNIIFTEERFAANDFLGLTTSQWEKESAKAEELGLRTVILRTGVVFSSKSKALLKMMMPIKYGFGSDLGTGKQFIPWIHLHDLARMYLFAIENEISGIFNAVAPEHITQHHINKQIAQKLNKPLFLPPIPEFFLKILLGEMAVIITRGSRVDSSKIIEKGFNFEIKTFKKVLENPL
jgi:uncharacterized protein